MTKLLISTTLFLACVQGQTDDWRWRATAPLGEARADACSVRLADGRVLVTGGMAEAPLSSVERFRALPQESFETLEPMNHARAGHACLLLEDGRVLVVGGAAEGASSAELFDPGLGQWTEVQSAVARRKGVTATALWDGRVLIAGGDAADLEIFDPASGTMEILPVRFAAPRTGLTATLLRTGIVLLAGGAAGGNAVDTAEIFDPVESTLSLAAPLNGARRGHTATLLHDGRVLIAGGQRGEEDLASLEVYDPWRNRFTTLAASLAQARRSHFAVLNPGNGAVLLAGGLAAGAPLDSSELFDAESESLRPAGNLTVARSGLTGVVLEDGRILAIGGLTSAGATGACGVISGATVRFFQGSYAPGERAVVLGNVGTSFTGTVSFALARTNLATGVRTDVSNRLLRTLASVSGGVLVATPILDATNADAGHGFELLVRVPGIREAISAQFGVKFRPNLSVQTPRVSTVAGRSVPVQVLLSVPVEAPASFVTVTMDSEAGRGVPAVVRPVPAGLIHSIPAILCCPTNAATGGVRATFSGTILIEGATTPFVSHRVISRIPTITVLPTRRLALGSSSGLDIRVVSTGENVPELHPDGFVFPNIVGHSVVVDRRGSDLDQRTAYTSFFTTPLVPTIADRRTGLCLAPTYSGDHQYASVSAPQTCLPVAPAETQLVFTSSIPATYNFGDLINIGVRLTWPDQVGIVGRVVNLIDQSGRIFAQITLTPDPTGRGIAEGSAQVRLPFNLTRVLAEYPASGDLARSSTAQFTTAMNPIQPVLVFDTASTVTNPFSLGATFRLPSGLPNGVALGGAVAFSNGATVLGTVPGSTLLVLGGINDGTSNTLITEEAVAISVPVRLPNVILPLGERAITVTFSGSDLFRPVSVTGRVVVQ